MARPIQATPRLNAKESAEFLKKMKETENRKPTKKEIELAKSIVGSSKKSVKKSGTEKKSVPVPKKSKKRVSNQQKVLNYLTKLKLVTSLNKISEGAKLGESKTRSVLHRLKKKDLAGFCTSGSNFQGNLKIYWGLK